MKSGDEMKMERLLAMIIMLLNRKRVQAKELADTYGVSIRTIYRDIDTITMAGIPVVTYQGAGGGIGLIEGYHLERGILTNEEIRDIVVGLQSISSVVDEKRTSHLLEKFRQLNVNTEQQGNLTPFVVDYSNWKQDEYEITTREHIKETIQHSLLLSFQYCSGNGIRSERLVEPHILVLKGQRWYLYAYCLDRQAFRLFKVSRMTNLCRTEQHFEPRNLSLEVLPWNQEFATSRGKIPNITLEFNERSRHIAEEWFGSDTLEFQQDTSTYLVSVPYPEDEWLYRFILGMGADVIVREPIHLRHKVRELALKIAEHYKS